jgi:hypothetical protein
VTTGVEIDSRGALRYLAPARGRKSWGRLLPWSLQRMHNAVDVLIRTSGLRPTESKFLWRHPSPWPLISFFLGLFSSFWVSCSSVWLSEPASQFWQRHQLCPDRDCVESVDQFWTADEHCHWNNRSLHPRLSTYADFNLFQQCIVVFRVHILHLFLNISFFLMLLYLVLVVLGFELRVLWLRGHALSLWCYCKGIVLIWCLNLSLQ